MARNRIVGVCLTDTKIEDYYNASRVEDCHSSRDREIFKTVMATGECAELGTMVGFPIIETP